MSLQLPDVISPSYCIPCNLFYYMTQWIQHGRQGCVCTRLLYDPSSFSWLPQFFRSAKRRMNNCKPSTTRITGQPDRTTEGTRYILRCLKQPEKKVRMSRHCAQTSAFPSLVQSKGAVGSGEGRSSGLNVTSRVCQGYTGIAQCGCSLELEARYIEAMHRCS
jgi:hypothetical protein